MDKPAKMGLPIKMVQLDKLLHLVKNGVTRGNGPTC